MNVPYACKDCADDIPSAASHFVTEYAQFLCAPCAEDSAGHAVLYPSRGVVPHHVLDHPLAIGTRLGTHRALLRIRRAQEVACG